MLGPSLQMEKNLEYPSPPDNTVNIYGPHIYYYKGSELYKGNSYVCCIIIESIFDMYVLFLLTHNQKLYNVEGKEHSVVLRPKYSPTEYMYSEVPL